MSFDALAWASKCRVGSASRKLVLLALADRHNTEEEVARPSVAWIAEWADLNRKTVINSLAELERAGLISDSGQRAGATMQVKAYRLHIGTVPKAVQSQKRNSSDISVKQSQKRDTEPVLEPTPLVIANAITPPAAEIVDDVLKPEHIVEAWNDLANRYGFSKAKLTPERQRKLKTRIRHCTADDFTEAISAFDRSSFLRGENDRGWKPNLDWLLEPKNFTKVQEGAYDR